MERFAQLAATALNQILESPITAADLESPPDPKLGDFGFPCFRLAKSMRLAPPAVAQKLVADLKARNAVPAGLEIAAVGPYVNFIVPPREALDALLKDLLAGDDLGAYGRLPADSRGRWVLEYSSPNVAKPFNIYHLRPTALGAALDRIGRFRGWKVTSINHLGDWGTQYGKLAVAFKMFAAELPKDPSIDDMVAIYVKFHQAIEKDPTLEDQAREAFLKLEKGDPEITRLWLNCVAIARKEFDRLYERLGVRFDHIWGESHYKDLLAPLISHLRERDLLVKSEGAWVVEVKDDGGKELPPCILEKSDGATIYATRDVAAALYRYEKFQFDRMTYIVGGEQRLHFQQVFAVLKRMGLEWASRCEHVPTGLYRFKDAKMSTRKGNFVTLEEVLGLAKERVKALIEKRARQAFGDESLPSASATHKFDAMDPAETEKISEAVAIGAVVFNDLHTDPARDVEFDVERVVAFEGETGPYLQYAHTRCLSILRKAQETGATRPGGIFDAALLGRLGAPEEITLVKTLGQMPLHLERTLRFAKASQLAHYLFDVTSAFGAFYRECHVLGDDRELTHARLMLVEATRRTLARGLTLLGIPLPQRM